MQPYTKTLREKFFRCQQNCLKPAIFILCQRIFSRIWFWGCSFYLARSRLAVSPRSPRTHKKNECFYNFVTPWIVLTIASTFKKGTSVHPWMDFAGLFIIAMGTGGIKPCVSAFGADQFKSHYLIMISYFFSVFYFMINAGSTISTFLTPEFRGMIYLFLFIKTTD